MMHAEIPRAERLEGWVRLLKISVEGGLDLDARSFAGETLLGMCLSQRPYANESGAFDPRVQALLSLGADPSKAPKHWLSCFEEDKATYDAMRARMESEQIDPDEASRASKPTGRASL